MSNTPGLAHSVPPLQTGAKTCSRCGKDFHLLRQKKNCYNCGSMVCPDCSNFRAKLPQFGYNNEVRCCAYCAHFLQGHAGETRSVHGLLAYATMINAVSGLDQPNMAFNISLITLDLIRAVQSYKPIPEASEVYFRQHLPVSPEKSSSLFEELIGLRGSESSESSQSSSSNGSGDGWSWDIDKFFSKLFGSEDRDSTTQTRPNRSQPQSQSQPRQAQARPPNTGTTYSSASSTPGPSYRPPAGNPPPTPYSSSSYYAQSRPANFSPSTPSPRPQAQTAPIPRAAPATNGTASRPQPQTSQPPRSTQQTSLTLEQLMTSKTDPSTLPIKTIKAILDHSCVTYVGIVEKRDLVARLQKLIDNTRAEQEKLQEQEEASKSKSPTESTKEPPGGGGNEDDNLCKICCDAALNCVMLNCNHMSTCMDCGKLIMEGSRMCPICREYVVRLLHVFRA
ncbi:RING finger protein 34 [Mortierella sp. AD094]|nr:RING finger protein 34 [Mortierella sp. AD094]